MLDVDCLTGFAPESRAVSGPVVGHDSLDVDPSAAKGLDGTQQESGAAFLGFVRQDLDVAQAGVIVDTDMNEVPPDSCRAMMPTFACDPVSDALNSPQFLDVDVQELAGALPLLAHRWS